ncbi:MAG TPA: acyltransferase [Burkholderiaceae bacterium]|nr:acyltransferase [Burkholderiaceae bacterium]
MNAIAPVHAPSERARIDALDGLRALAMTAVIAQHCHLLPFGWTGVWLFFLISGYVITLGFDRGDYAGHGPAERLGAFIARRALRIVPAYLLYLAVCTIVLLSMNRRAPLADLPHLLSFIANWHMIGALWPTYVDWAPFGHLWTLSVEQQFYLLFPLIVLGVPRRAQVPVMLALVACGPLVRALASVWLAHDGGDPGAMAFAIYAATPCHIDAFLMGALAARLQPWWRDRPRATALVTLAGLGVPALYAATYVAINRHLGMVGIDQLRNVFSGVLYGQGREVLVYLAVDLAALAVIVQALRRSRGLRWLAWFPLVWVGRVSYGGYLFHALVVWGLARMADLHAQSLPLASRLAFFAAAWALTVALAGLSFHGLEQPIARRWRANGRRRAPGTGHDEVRAMTRIA